MGSDAIRDIHGHQKVAGGGESVFEGEIFDDEGALTAGFLIARGYCCALQCKNCPYRPRHGGKDAVLPEGADSAERNAIPARLD